MDTITIKIEGNENVSFFVSLLQKFNFIKDIKVNNKKTVPKNLMKEAPIDWADKKPSIDDFTGIWSNNSITLNEIRSKAWKRN